MQFLGWSHWACVIQKAWTWMEGKCFYFYAKVVQSVLVFLMAWKHCKTPGRRIPAQEHTVILMLSTSGTGKVSALWDSSAQKHIYFKAQSRCWWLHVIKIKANKVISFFFFSLYIITLQHLLYNLSLETRCSYPAVSFVPFIIVTETITGNCMMLLDCATFLPQVIWWLLFSIGPKEKGIFL